MFKKKDLLLIAAILVLAGGIFLWHYLSARNTSSAGVVRVWVDGEVHSEYALGKERDVIIRQDNGCENVIHLTENGFYMHSSTCKNQLCIQQGTVTEDNYRVRAMGTHVQCLPNRVDVELVVTSSETTLPPDLPDIDI